MALVDFLKTMVEHDASDLYITVDAPASIKVDGKMTPITDKPLTVEDVKQVLYDELDDDQRAEFEKELELNFAIFKPEVGRFRSNYFFQRHQPGAVLRCIKTDIPTPEMLKLPETLKKLIMEKRGLILVVGATGSGKSTTLASLIDFRNENSRDHIITVEDPIEYVYNNKESIINQREVGVDTKSYEEALKNTLRQAPDVILIGEIRAQETMEHAIAFAETGHLCLSTLHANNANQALDRIISFFPKDGLAQLLLDLSLNLKGIISQRLIPTVQGGRTAAIEILINTPLVADKIKRGDVDSLKEIMEKSDNLGMCTFDMCLYRLYKEGTITYDEAIKNADSKNNLRLKIQLQERQGDSEVLKKMEIVQDSNETSKSNQFAPKEPPASINTAPQKKPVKTQNLSLKDDDPKK